MAVPDREILERKLGFLNRYRKDLGAIAVLDPASRRQQHYAVERLLQLLCECAADIALQFLKAEGETLPASYREIFRGLERRGALPSAMAAELVAACGMRNVLTHLYDDIDLDRVMAAIDPALTLYAAFSRWALDRLGFPSENNPPKDPSPSHPD
jgi:uncharacterized protein YutE (UPF0331/DUF86 family)